MTNHAYQHSKYENGTQKYSQEIYIGVNQHPDDNHNHDNDNHNNISKATMAIPIMTRCMMS